VKRGPEAWKIAALGWTGNASRRSQVMKLVMQGITRFTVTRRNSASCTGKFAADVIAGDDCPLLGAAILGVLESHYGDGIAHEVGKHTILQGWWNFFSPLRRWSLRCWR